MRPSLIVFVSLVDSRNSETCLHAEEHREMIHTRLVLRNIQFALFQPKLNPLPAILLACTCYTCCAATERGPGDARLLTFDMYHSVRNRTRLGFERPNALYISEQGVIHVIKKLVTTYTRLNRLERPSPRPRKAHYSIKRWKRFVIPDECVKQTLHKRSVSRKMYVMCTFDVRRCLPAG